LKRIEKKNLFEERERKTANRIKGLGFFEWAIEEGF
jgi:hypothetical protein